MRSICTLFAICVLVASGFVYAGDHSHRAVEVDDYYVDDGTIHVSFNINEEKRAGSFTWEVAFDFAGSGRKDSSSANWSAGDTSASASMFLGSDVKVRRVKVTRVNLR